MKGTPENCASRPVPTDKEGKVLTVAFTWSPAPNLQRTDPQAGYKNQLPILKTLIKCCEYIKLHPEFHMNGTLHYHAILKITDQIKWYRSVLPNIRANGFVVIKKNLDCKWMDYIEKDWEISKAVLDLETPLDLQSLKTYRKPHQRLPPSDSNSLLKYLTIREIPNNPVKDDMYRSVFVQPTSYVEPESEYSSSEYEVASI